MLNFENKKKEFNFDPWKCEKEISRSNKQYKQNYN